MSELRATAVWLAALALAGCELFAYADRDMIPRGTGGTGGAGGAGGGGDHDAGAAGGGHDGGHDAGHDAAPVACVYAFDCPATGDDCILRTCVDGRCGTKPAPAGQPTSMQVPYDCMRSVCDGAGHAEMVVDLTDVPVDGNPCTDDLCSGGHPINLPSAPGNPCPMGVCDGLTHCVACINAANCGPEQGCVDNACVPMTCTDGVQDGTETDVDCGGPACAPCALGKKCGAPVDCATLVCTGGVCAAAAATCSDQVQDGSETGVDCGGPACPPCAIGEGCAAATDCLSGRCAAGVCAPRVVVSQVRSRGPNGPYDEFVELYNPTRVAETLDASWTLSTRSALDSCAAQTERPLFTASGQTLAPHGHLLLGGTAYAETPSPDAALAIGGVEDAASVVLRQGAAVVSALCYAYDATTLASLTSCSVPYVCEGTPASNLPHDNTESAQSLADASLDRKPGGALGNTAITGDSSADFTVIMPALPESAASPPVP